MENLRSYLVWIIATFFVVYSFCLNTAASVFSGAIQNSLHATDMNVSLATSTFIIGFAIMQIPGGYLLDKYNACWVVSTSIFILALGNLLISFSTSVTLYALANFLQGIGGAFAFIAAAVLISQWFTARKFPVLFGITQTIACLFAGILHYYFTVFLTLYSWNRVYQGLSVFGFVLFALSLIFISSPKNHSFDNPISFKKSLQTVTENSQIWLCTVAAAASFGVILAYAALWYLPVQQFYAVDHMQALIISAYIFAGIGFGTPIWGIISNHFNSRTMIIHITLCLGTMALLSGIYMPDFSVQTLIIAKGIGFLIGFFCSGAMLFYTIVNESASHETRGVAISLLNTGVFLFNSVMLFIPYLLITDHSRNFYTYLWILPFCLIFAILVLYFIRDIGSEAA